MELLERDDELATLDGLLDLAADGRGGVALVSGEPGIGKSSLVSTWSRTALDRARVLTGACDDLLTRRTLGPFRDLVRGTDGPLARALDDGASRDDVLAAAQTEFSNPLRATVVVLEDLHWADEASLDVLRFLARRIVGAPTLIVATYRDDLPDAHPLHATLGGLVGPAVTRIPLAGLSARAVARLAGPSGLPAQDLHEATGGNPFFVTEAIAAPGDEVPVTIRETVAARLRDLDPATRTSLEQLSVSPGGLELHLVDAVISGGAHALAGAERLHLVDVVGSKVRFRHELLRRAVSATTPVAALTGAHARLLASLDPQRTDPSRLAHHARGAGDTAALVIHARAAAHAAIAVGAHRDAAAALEQALRYPEFLDARNRAQARTDLARELLLVNRLDEGLQEAEAAVQEWERLDDAEGLGVALTVLSDARYWGLMSETAAAAAQRAVDTLGPLPPGRSLACATSTLAFALVMSNRFADALAAADRAVTIARDVDAPDVLAHALAQRGTARSMLGDDGGAEDLAEGFRIAIGIPHHQHVVLTSIGIASASFRSGRFADAEEAMSVGLDYAEEHDLEAGVATLQMMRAGLDLARGAWTDAEEWLTRTVGDGTGTGWGETVTMALLGRLRARQGDDTAREMLDRAWAIAVRSGEIQRVGPVAAACMEWGWLTGRTEEIRERVEFAVAAARGVGHTWYLGELLRYLALVDGTDTIAATAAAGDELPEPWASGLRGDWRTAAQGWQRLGWPYERAIELASSQDTDATFEALTILDGLGATATAALVRRRLRERGVRGIPRGPREETRENPAGLTARQMEVLRLVVDGATNPQIAEQLVVSPRTVDHHVSAVLTKLGVTSRREVPARAVELGLDVAGARRSAAPPA